MILFTIYWWHVQTLNGKQLLKKCKFFQIIKLKNHKFNNKIITNRHTIDNSDSLTIDNTD